MYMSFSLPRARLPRLPLSLAFFLALFPFISCSPSHPLPNTNHAYQLLNERPCDLVNATLSANRSNPLKEKQKQP